MLHGAARELEMDPDLVETKPMRHRRESLEAVCALVQTLDDLGAERTPWQIASVCASAVARTLRATAVVIHEIDEGAEEARAIGVFGADSEDLLGTVTKVAESVVLSTVLSSKGEVTLRLAQLHARSVFAFSVSNEARCVVVVEIADVDDERVHCIPVVVELLTERLVEAFGAPD